MKIYLIITSLFILSSCGGGSGSSSVTPHTKVVQISSAVQTEFNQYKSGADYYGFPIDDLIIEVSPFDSSINYDSTSSVNFKCIKNSNSTPKAVIEETTWNNSSTISKAFAFWQLMGLCHMNKNWNNETWQETDWSTSAVKNIPYSFMYPGINSNLWTSQRQTYIETEIGYLQNYYWANPTK